MRRGMRTSTWLGAAPLLALLAVAVSGCLGGPPAAGPNNLAPLSKQTLNYQLVTGSSDISGLDPDVNFDDLQPSAPSAHAGALLPISLIYSGLVTFDSHLAVKNWDAQRIEVSADGLTYTFHLRTDLKFSDGKAVTSADYAYSINRTLDPCLASPVAPYLYEIKDSQLFNGQTCVPGTGGAAPTYGPGYGQTTPVLKDLFHDSVLTPDPKTLVLKLGAPAAYFLAALAYPCSYAIEQSAVGGGFANSSWTANLVKGATGQGGSGPYYVSACEHKGSLVLKANPNFRQQPHLQTITISIFSDASAAYGAYQAGKSDIGYPPAAQLAQAAKQGDYHQGGVLWINYLGLNWKMAPFNDARARQAFALALNKDQLNATVLHGAQTPTNHLVPQGMPGYNEALKGPAGVTNTQGDANKAKTLWQQYVADKCGGQAGSCAGVTLTYSSSSPTAAALGSAMQQMWQASLGVKVSLQTEDFDTMLGQLATGTVQMWNIGWTAYYPDPQDWLSLQFLPGAQYNFGGVDIKDANTLLMAADTNANQSQRLQQYQQAEQLLADQVAWIPYDQVTDHWQIRGWVHGYDQTAQGQPSLDQWLSMYITNH